MEQLSEATRWQCFCKDVSWLLYSGDRMWEDSVAVEMMTNKMIVIFNVLGTFMENIILSKLNGIVIITVKYSSRLLQNTYINKKLTKLWMIFKFFVGARNNNLSLASLWDEGITFVEVVTYSEKMSIGGTTYPIKIIVAR